MSYKLNKTNGSLLTELVDGQIDNTSCDLTLIGRNYSGFGEALNENLIKLLENFAATAAPATPLTGQLWYDTSEGRLKVYDGTAFKSNGPIVSGTQPQMVAGDMWINNAANQLYFFDGTDLVLVGPVYTAAQELSGFQVDTVRDRSSVDHTVVKLYVGGTLTSIISQDEFLPTALEQSRLNITSGIRKGINVIDQDNFRFYGVSDSTNSLITAAIDPVTGLRIRKTASQFLPSDSNGETTGSLAIRNQSGLTVGRSGETRFFVSGDFTNIQNTIVDKGFRFRLLNQQDNEYDALTMTANTRRMGVNLPLGRLPRATLDVNGDVIIAGNLTVEGNNTIIETSTLSVDDYNIEIGHADTVITLDAALSSIIADQLAVGELITQVNSGATATFKSISANRLVLTLEPINGLFISGEGNNLEAAVAGILFRADEATPVYPVSLSQRTDSTANGAGIVVKGSPSFSNTNDKHIKWINDTVNGTNWEFSDSVNLISSKAYKIDDILLAEEVNPGASNELRLGDDVETAMGLRDVGIMDRLRVHDSMTLDELTGVPTISTTVGLTINSAGTITVKNGAFDVKITGVADPITASDAANKNYVDTQIDSEPVTFALDISGMPDVGFATVDAQILDVLEFLYPAASKQVGARARIYTSSSVGVVSGIDVESAFNYTSIGADFSDINVIEPFGTPPTSSGPSNQQLVQDIGFTGSATGIVTLSVTRAKRYFIVVNVGGNKAWQTTVGP